MKKRFICLFLLLFIFLNITTSSIFTKANDRMDNEIYTADIELPKIERYPAPADFSFLQNNLGAEFPSFDPNSSDLWQVDVRSCDLTQYDLYVNPKTQGFVYYPKQLEEGMEIPEGFKKSEHLTVDTQLLSAR